jgi:mRNA deadenylase 3'-5' endonuclease subunit Ccr4
VVVPIVELVSVHRYDTHSIFPMPICQRDVGRIARILIHVFTFNVVVAWAIIDIAASRRFRKIFALRSDGDMNFGPDGEEQLEVFSECVDECGILSLVSEVKNDDGSIAQRIRVEKETNSSSPIATFNKEDVAQMIREAREEQFHFGRADLYQRDWESCAKSIVGENSVSTSNVASFSVMQFNTLAEGLSSCQAKRPFKIQEPAAYQQNPNEYGGFTSIPHPSILLDFGNRRWRLLEVVLGPNLDAPYDIIALEEVDRYRGFFAPVLKLFGYDSIFVPKKNSPGVRLGWYSDGCVLAWRKSVFCLVDRRIGEYSVGNQVYILAALQHRTSGQSIVVGATHLKAQQSEINELIRCRQVGEFLSAIDQEIVSLTSVGSVSLETLSVILLGDFNADPPFQMKADPSAIKIILTHAGLNMNSNCTHYYESAYNVVDPTEDLFTSWKIRGSKEVKRVIDYIFYAGISLRCTETLKIVPILELEETKLPGLRHPSDHLHICAKFEIHLNS